MAEAFDFTLQSRLAAPPTADIRKVRKDLEASFAGLNINIVDNKVLQRLANQTQRLTKTHKEAIPVADRFGDVVALKGKNFAAYTIASAAVLKLTNIISKATTEALKFEVELAKISQTIGRSNEDVKQYSNRIIEISKNFGLSQTKVAELVRVLSQSGLAFKTALQAAEKLARTSLLATFDNLTSTTEALIALMASFELSVDDAASALDAINSVSKRFAVESSDIVEAIKRTGGAFKAAGGNINELIALFTSVRSTSRESAETIATAFRTIFGRLQRPRTIEFFKQLNIELLDANGNFVGAFEAIKRISAGLERAGIAAGSIEFAQVVEQIGGIRQLSKVVPLLQQFGKAQSALAVANQGVAETDADIIKAKETLGQKIKELQANFNALITEVSQSKTFNFLVTTFIKIADSVVEASRAFKEFIPLLTIVAGIKLTSGITSIIKGGFRGPVTGGSGSGSFGRFASGGIVPGQGNGDTVPAMLTPGEFVIRKSAVQAFGAQNLAGINKYAKGDVAKKRKRFNPDDPKNLIQNRFLATITDNASITGKELSNTRAGKSLTPQALGGLRGILFEKAVSEKYGVNVNTAFPDIVGSKASTLVGKARLKRAGIDRLAGVELKYANTKSTRASYRKGYKNKFPFSRSQVPMVYGYNSGGAVGTDTVPALLTPGEFVVNRQSAKAFGYSNLRRINKYAKGGVVQKFQDGGVAGAATTAIGLSFSGLDSSLVASISQILLFSQAMSSITKVGTDAAESVQTFAKKIDDSVKKRKRLNDLIEKNNTVLSQAKAKRESLNSELERSIGERRRQFDASVKAGRGTIGGNTNLGDQGVIKLQGDKDLQKAYLKVVKEYKNDVTVTRNINKIKREFGQGTRASAAAIVAYGRTLKEAKKANIRSIQEIRKDIKASEALIKAKEKRTRDLLRVKEGRGIGGAFGRIGSKLKSAGPAVVLTGVATVAEFLSSRLEQTAEAADKLAQKAIESGNVQEAVAQTTKRINEQAAADSLKQGALAGATIGGIIGSLTPLGPIGGAIGAALGGLTGGILGATGYLTKFTDALGLTNSELDRQQAIEKARTDALANSLRRLSEATDKNIKSLEQAGASADRLISAAIAGLSGIGNLVRQSGGRISFAGSGEEDKLAQEQGLSGIDDLFNRLQSLASEGIDFRDVMDQTDLKALASFLELIASQTPGLAANIKARLDALKALIEEARARNRLAARANREAQKLFDIQESFNNALVSSSNTLLKLSKGLQLADSALNILNNNIQSIPASFEKLDSKLSGSVGFKNSLDKLSQLGIEGASLSNEIKKNVQAFDVFKKNLRGASQVAAKDGSNAIGFDKSTARKLLKDLVGGDEDLLDSLITSLFAKNKTVIGFEDFKSFAEKEFQKLTDEQIKAANDRLQVEYDTINKIRDVASRRADIELNIVKSQVNLAKSLQSIDDSLSTRQKSFNQIAREQSQRGATLAGAAGFNIGGGTLSDQSKRVADELFRIQEEINKANQDDVKLKESLIGKQKLLREAFTELTDTSALLQAAQQKQAEILKKKSLAEELTFGGRSQRQQFQQNLSASQFLAAGGSAQQLNEGVRGQLLQFLRQFANTEVAGGFTGQELIDQETRRSLLSIGLPIEQVEKLLAGSVPLEQQQLDQLVIQTNYLSQLASNAALNELPNVNGQATGGLVYRNNGGSIFKPKGTDTVPAMLTPGEFVIRKSAVDKIGADNLAAMNNGGKVAYKFLGGLLGADADLQRRKRRLSYKESMTEEQRMEKFGVNKTYLGSAQLAKQLADQEKQRKPMDFTDSSGGVYNFPELLAKEQPEQQEAIVYGIDKSRSPNLASAKQALIEYGSSIAAASKTAFSNIQAGAARVKEFQESTFEFSPEGLKAANAAGNPFSAKINELDMLLGNPRVSARRKQQINQSMIRLRSFEQKYDRQEREGTLAPSKTSLIAAQKQRERAGRGRSRRDFTQTNSPSAQPLPESASPQTREEKIADFRARAAEKLAQQKKAKEARNQPTALPLPESASPQTREEKIDAFRARAAEKLAQQKKAKEARNQPKLFSKSQDFDRKTGEFRKTNPRLAQLLTQQKINSQYSALNASRDEILYGRANRFRRSRFDRARRYASGGSVDTVPAMLTPGEFVMSPESVNKYGVGFMQSLNKGKVPGFRKGGLVYRHDGGSVGGGSFDFDQQISKLTQVFNVFSESVARFESIPTDFTMSIAPVNVTLSIVGGEIFNSLKPSLKKMVKQMIANSIPEITRKVTQNQRGGFT